MFRDDDTLSQPAPLRCPGQRQSRPAVLISGSRLAAHNQRGGLGDPHQVQPEVAVGSW